MNNYLFACNTEGKKILNFESQKNITTYLNYSLPLCSFCWDLSKTEWIYEHFTQIYLMKGTNDYVWLDYLEDLYFPSDILDYSFMPMKEMQKIDDIVSYIKNLIDNGFQLTIMVDKYFIETTNLYKKDEHVPIQLYINGYDDRNKEFIGVGFQTDSTFTSVTYSYQEMQDGFNSIKKNDKQEAIWVEWYACTLMKLKNCNQKYSFSPSKFLIDLENFISSKKEPNKLRPEISFERGNDAIYGLSAQYEIIESIKSLYDGNFVTDYRHIHLLNEHKQLLLKKLTATSERLNISSKVEGTIKEYNEVCKKFSKIRLLYAKQVLADNSFSSIFEQLKNKKIISEIINLMKETTYEEENILKNFLSKIN